MKNKNLATKLIEGVEGEDDLRSSAELQLALGNCERQFGASGRMPDGTGADFSEKTYEEGVRDALSWALGRIPSHEFPFSK